MINVLKINCGLLPYTKVPGNGGGGGGGGGKQINYVRPQSDLYMHHSSNYVNNAQEKETILLKIDMTHVLKLISH